VGVSQALIGYWAQVVMNVDFQIVDLNVLHLHLAGNREKAMSLLDELLTTPNKLGMRPLMGRVLWQRDFLKSSARSYNKLLGAVHWGALGSPPGGYGVH